MELVGNAGLPLREAVRMKEAPYAELGLHDPAKSDDQMLNAIEAHPIFLNRPFVATTKATRLCPLEIVLDILENP
jgi:arsenate reductase-like glutaredoxin family protein